MNKLLSFSIILTLLLAGLATAQPTAVIQVLGVSDRDAAVSEEDIFTRTSTGLPNVGVGEMVYLEGNPGNDDITGYTWTLQVPEGSESALSAEDAAIVYFVPDMVGVFRVGLTVTSGEGQSEAASTPVNSANYVGVGGIVGNAQFPQCATCHAEKAQEWHGTGHSDMFSRSVDGLTSDHYGASCIRCHTLGYDTDEIAVNGGFDDIAADEGWTFPEQLAEGNWDAMVENFPRSAALTNIQCESCHGPGSAHQGPPIVDNEIVFTMTNDVCAKCHDSGTHHTRPYQWDFSGHAKVTTRPSGPGRESCVRCHTGYGFVDYVKGVEEPRTDYLPITCAACHDPHDATNEHQLRVTAGYELENGETTDLGLGNLCATCHHARTNGPEYAMEYHDHFGPHRSPQADMLIGTNAIEYGRDIPSTPHAMEIENACVGCHMYETPAEDQPGYLEIGEHSFAMVSEDGVENVAACADCHGEIESFESIMADEDWDGDEQIESVMMEVEGMMEALAMLLYPLGEPEVEVMEWFTEAQLKAAFNYLFVEEDGSHGMHNAAYARGILQAALDDRDNLGVEPIDGAQPYEWSLGDAYPNPFNPSSTVNYSLAQTSQVSFKIFAMDGRLVREINPGVQQAGAYRRVIDLRGQPSGMYLLSMNAGSFTANRKLVLMK